MWRCVHYSGVTKEKDVRLVYIEHARDNGASSSVGEDSIRLNLQSSVHINMVVGLAIVVDRNAKDAAVR